MRAHPPSEWTLRVDWPNCAARGLCAELLPERVRLDEWGFPVMDGEVTRELLGLAKTAVSACPHSALRLVAATSSRRVGRPSDVG